MDRDYKSLIPQITASYGAWGLLMKSSISMPSLVAAVLLHAVLVVEKAIADGPIPGHIIAAQQLPQGNFNGVVMDINPATGARQIISNYPSIGTGPNFLTPWSIDLLPDGNLLLVDDLKGLYKIDLATGNRTFISGSGGSSASGYPSPRGAGPAFSESVSVVLGPGGQAIVVNYGGGTPANPGFITSVDLVSGDRTLISGQGVGTGPTFGNPRGGVIGSDGHLYLADFSLREIFDVNLSTGARSILSGATSGTGPGFGNLMDIMTLQNGTFVVADFNSDFVQNYTGSLFLVDPSTGDRSLISTGPHLTHTYDRIAAGLNGDILGSVNGVPGSIYSIDPATGIRTLVTGGPTMAGPNDLRSGDMVVIPIPEPPTIALVVGGLPLMATSLLAAIGRRSQGTKNGGKRAHSAF